ncbi:MAG: hypothetical protein ACRDJS_02885 [Actinomycetota bacterium]
MPSRRSRRLEDLAALEVGRLTGARVEKRDTGAKQSMRDFEIVFSDGRRGALEVTQLTEENMEAIMGALDKVGLGIETTALTRRWYLWLSLGNEPFRGASLRDLRKNVVGFLASLEQDGVTEFYPDPWRPSSRAVDQLLSRFPVLDSGTSSTIQEQPRVQILPPGMAGIAEAETLVELIRAVAWLPDNRRKLDVDGVDDRHLFVWVHPWLPAATALDEPAPDIAVHLPPEVSHLWVALNTSAPPRRLWRYSATSGWFHHEAP